jgi:hypothetical protein
MTSQTPEEAARGTELNEEDNAVIDAVFMWEGTLEAPADFPGTLTEALAPALAAIRRHAAAQALREQADRLGKISAKYVHLANDATPGSGPADMWAAYATQARTDGRMLLLAADDVIAEGWEFTCAAETPATREDPAEGCETPVENEGDYCPKHEPADDYDPRDDR